jgi:hypothetical protein
VRSVTVASVGAVQQCHMAKMDWWKIQKESVDSHVRIKQESPHPDLGQPPKRKQRLGRKPRDIVTPESEKTRPEVVPDLLSLL